MVILFLANSLKGIDGWSKVSLDYAKELQNLGHGVFCLTRPLLGPPLKYLANPLVSFSTALKVKKKNQRAFP